MNEREWSVARGQLSVVDDGHASQQMTNDE
jgi:hypothetical protein